MTFTERARLGYDILFSASEHLDRVAQAEGHDSKSAQEASLFVTLKTAALRDANMILKTEEQWRASKTSLTEFLQVGDFVDDCIFEYMLCVLPPACHTVCILQIGESYAHVAGRETFITLYRPNANRPWKYVGICHHNSFADVWGGR